MKKIVAIIGKSGAGKETVYKIIKDELKGICDVSIHHFSDPLNEILEILKLPKERPNQQTLSTILRQSSLKNRDGNIAGEELLGGIIKERALDDPAYVVFLDGVRRPQDVAMLRSFPDAFLVLVTAPIEKRLERIRKRNDRPGDADKTLEQFLVEQSAEAETRIDEIGREADVVFDNSVDDPEFKHLEMQIRKFLSDNKIVYFCSSCDHPMRPDGIYVKDRDELRLHHSCAPSVIGEWPDWDIGGSD